MCEKILLVDDNTDLLLITQIILKGQGYEVFLAQSIKEAERKVKIHRPSLVLLDVCMGADDGCRFCKDLKACHPGLRVILMSGREKPSINEDGADDFLPKPFDFNQLVLKVQAQLEGEAVP